jgi:hypothetical protein
LKALWIAALLACAPAAQPALTARLLRTYPAAEAHQGAAADGTSLYAIANSEIGRYDKATGKKLAAWSGDPKRFPHLNSCAVIGGELVCANSNYPQTPMRSSVEVFEPMTLKHLRTIDLGEQDGSLTWVDRREGFWWAGLANYDGRGGAPGRDHRATRLVKLDDHWKRLQSWTFPEDVLARMAPRSASGGSFGPDGRLYVTGHDRAEMYVLAVPKSGTVLQHVSTIALPFDGQAFAFDRSQKGVVFGISRDDHTVVSARLP